MKRLLRNKKTRMFFNRGAWTQFASEAQEFGDVMEVIATCAAFQLCDMDMVLYFHDSGKLNVEVEVGRQS